MTQLTNNPTLISASVLETLLASGQITVNGVNGGTLQLSSGASAAWADVNYMAGGLQAVSNTAFAIDVLRAESFISGRTGAINRIGFTVTTLGTAGSVVRIGIYRASSVSYYPETLVVDSGIIATDAVSGFRSVAINVPVIAGELIWVVYFAGVAAPTVNSGAAFSQQSATVMGSPSTGLGNPNAQLTASLAFAALPATFPAGAIPALGPAPALALRFA